MQFTFDITYAPTPEDTHWPQPDEPNPVEPTVNGPASSEELVSLTGSKDTANRYPLLSAKQQAFEGLTNTQLVDRIIDGDNFAHLSPARAHAKAAGDDALEAVDGQVLAQLRSERRREKIAALEGIYGPAEMQKMLSREEKIVDHEFTDLDLFGSTGKPSPSDFLQTRTVTCYLASDAKALSRAGGLPAEMFSYDRATKSFNVTLFNPTMGRHPLQLDPAMAITAHTKPVAVTINVKQAEIRDNVLRGGISTIDDNFRSSARSVTGRLSPALLETAYAKANDSNPDDGLQEGYRRISGGSSEQTFFNLTGHPAHKFSVENYRQLETQQGRAAAETAMYRELVGEMRAGNAVTYAMLSHVYDHGPKSHEAHTFGVLEAFEDANGVAWVKLDDPRGLVNDHGQKDRRVAVFDPTGSPGERLVTVSQLFDNQKLDHSYFAASRVAHEHVPLAHESPLTSL